jgi:hypothetical protein
MKRHEISLDQALRHFLLTEDADAPPPPSSGWLEGPSLHEYEAHVLGAKPFTEEQMAWVQAHPACQRTLARFEQHYGKRSESPIVLAPGLPQEVSAEVAWDAASGQGRVDLTFPQLAVAGMLVFLQRVGQGLARVRRLDPMRRISFGALPPGEYRVVNSLLSSVLGEVSMVGAFASEEPPEPAVAAPLDLEQDFPEYSLHVSVKTKPLGEVEIAFESSDAELNGALVHFAFSERETGMIPLSGTVTLQKHPLQPERWVGTWRYPLNFGGTCELAFAVEKK